MSKAPSFRPVAAPLAVSDADLDQMNRRLGVPMLVPTSPQDQTPRPQPQAQKLRAVNIHLPEYVFRIIRERAHQQDTSIRFIVMKALADSGIDINAADLVEDARRSRN
ncbi:MAG: hypothetical protein AB7F78_11775 [Hyphomicrobiaceae bacterium]